MNHKEHEDEIRERWAKLPSAPWSIEPHGQVEALYSGRVSGLHGLNLVHLVEPAHQWPAVREAIVHAPEDIASLLASNKRLKEERDLLRAYVAKLEAAGTSDCLIAYMTGTCKDQAPDDPETWCRACISVFALYDWHEEHEEAIQEAKGTYRYGGDPT